MKISVISDTHGFLDERTMHYIAKSDEIWHAGDIGNTQIIDKLESLSGKKRLVYGNIDGQSVRIRSAENQIFTIDGLSMLITHIAGKPSSYNKRVRELIQLHNPDLLVCGHSHILKVEYDTRHKLLYINPGACGNHGFHKIRTIIQFEIKNGKPINF